MTYLEKNGLNRRSWNLQFKRYSNHFSQGQKFTNMSLVIAKITSHRDIPRGSDFWTCWFSISTYCTSFLRCIQKQQNISKLETPIDYIMCGMYGRNAFFSNKTIKLLFIYLNLIMKVQLRFRFCFSGGSRYLVCKLNYLYLWVHKHMKVYVVLH